MKRHSSPTVHGVVIAGLAAVLVVGCTASRTIHSSAPKPLPTSTITSAAEFIQLAADHECAQFSSTYSAMLADAQGTQTERALIALTAKDGGDWQHAFAAAAEVGNGPRVPVGTNIARTLAADMARDAVDVSKVRVAVGSAGFDEFSHAWNHAFTDLATTQSQCNL
jgi:hypothetical protein